mgnify:CR=1 FL=1
MLRATGTVDDARASVDARPASPTGLDIRDLSVTFQLGKGQSVRALDRVNLAIREGDFVVALGASGCGKTTLLNCLAGFLKPSDPHAYVYPKLAVGEVQKSLRDTGGMLGFSVKAIGKQLPAEGFLIDPDPLRTSTVVRHEGQTHRVWKIRKHDLGLVDQEDRDEAPW